MDKAAVPLPRIQFSEGELPLGRTCPVQCHRCRSESPPLSSWVDQDLAAVKFLQTTVKTFVLTSVNHAFPSTCCHCYPYRQHLDHWALLSGALLRSVPSGRSLGCSTFLFPLPCCLFPVFTPSSWRHGFHTCLALVLSQ